MALQASALAVVLKDVVPTSAVAVVAYRPNDLAAEGGLEPTESRSEPTCTSGVHGWRIPQVPFFSCQPCVLAWHLPE